MKDCWACRLAEGNPKEYKTRWFYRDEHGILVEDLNPKEYKIRLLYVPVGHTPVGTASVKILTRAYKIAMGVARALEPEISWKNAVWEVKEHSYRRHEHFQLCLR